MTNLVPKPIFSLPLKLYALGFLAAALIFTGAPDIDLRVAGWFASATGFTGNAIALLAWLHSSLGLLIAVYCVLAIVLSLKPSIHQPSRIDRRILLFLTLSLVIGPGLIGNTLLKDQWGRARPAQITEFGGAASFTPALVPSDQCATNCSFVAGDAALGFAFIALALVLPTRRRGGIIAASILGSLLGLMRIVQGGHFLSDVVFAGLIVGGSIWFLYWLVIERGQYCQRDDLPPDRYFMIALAVLGLFSIFWFDQPIAIAMRLLPIPIQNLFRYLSETGISTGYLIAGASLAVVHLVLGQLRPKMQQAWRRRSRAALFAFAAIAGSGLLNDLIKFLVSRARPKRFFATGDSSFHFWHQWLGHGGANFQSFPSGHAATAFAVATVLALYWPRFGPIAYIWAIAVALSRVAINAHWASDVIAGGLVGAMFTHYLWIASDKRHDIFSRAKIVTA